MVGCAERAGPEGTEYVKSTAPPVLLTHLVTATTQRPYSFRLPAGWIVNDRFVHADGAISFSSEPSTEGLSSLVGKAYGVLDAEGTLLPYVSLDREAVLPIELSPPGEDSSRSIRHLLVDGRPGTELVAEQPGKGLMWVSIRLKPTAGVQMLFSWNSDEYSLETMREIVTSLRFDDASIESAIRTSRA